MKVSTKLNKDSEAVKTILTLDFTNMTRENLEELAAKPATIMWQSECRAAGEIPATATVDVYALCNRERKARVQLTPAQLIAKLTPEQLKAAMIAAGMAVE